MASCGLYSEPVCEQGALWYLYLFLKGHVSWVVWGLGIGTYECPLPKLLGHSLRDQGRSSQLTLSPILITTHLMTSYLSLNSIQSTTISQVIRWKTDFCHVRGGREMGFSCGVNILQIYADNLTMKLTLNFFCFYLSKTN